MSVEAPPWEVQSDALGEALHGLRMRRAFYSRAELSDPWALEMPAVADFISFHVVTAGSCWLEATDADPVELRPGDAVLVPHGRGHLLTSDPGRRPAARVDHLPQRYYGEHYSVLRYGGGGRLTRAICGVVGFDEPAARALVAALPPVIHVDATTTSGAGSIHDTIRLLGAELDDVRPGGRAVTTRLADIVVVQAIRAWLDHDPDARDGWLGALRDERIGGALTAMHRAPGADWNLDLLAEQATMSRSSFAARFRQLVGEPPMGYLTRWRMNLAYVRLRDSTETIGSIAVSLGYRSEAAFTRAFTRVVGMPPSAARTEPAPMDRADARRS